MIWGKEMQQKHDLKLKIKSKFPIKCAFINMGSCQDSFMCHDITVNQGHVETDKQFVFAENKEKDYLLILCSFCATITIKSLK